MKKISLICILFMIFTACNRVSQKAKITINKTGEVVGETATEFFEGVAEGVDKTLECEIVLSNNLKKKGLKTGSFSIQTQKMGGNKNQLTLYVIFEEQFSGTVIAKAYDKKELEIGRSKIIISGEAKDARYFDFLFDERTNIGVRNKILLE